MPFKGPTGRRAWRRKKEGDEPEQLEDGAAKDYQSAIDFFVEGLGYFRRLYEAESYWEALRNKGRLLATSAHPFNEAEFDGWKSSALLGQAQTLVDFAVHAANHDTKNGAARAKSALTNLRHCDLPKEMVEVLMVRFAECFLDRDPTAIPPGQFGAAMARAECVLQMDPDNRKTLEFIVRGHTYSAETSVNEESGVIAERIGSVRQRAELLEQQIPGTR